MNSNNYDEDSLLPISALQHLMFCERQWALIHLEQIWEENILTAKGRQLHERVDCPEVSTTKGIKVARKLRLRSLKYGLSGYADVVEFLGSDLKKPYPVEYKRGKPKNDSTDIVQLCAQALCLEEMYHTGIDKGAFFYGEIRHRREIEFTDEIRAETIALIKKLHQATATKKTPLAKYEKKCQSCSLLDWCMPHCTDGTKMVEKYIDDTILWSSKEES